MKKDCGRIVMALVVLVMVLAIGNYYENHYTREVRVVEIDCLEITVADNYGHEWVYLGDDVEVGDSVELKMFSNNTVDDVEDDVVLNAKRIEK